MSQMCLRKPDFCSKGCRGRQFSNSVGWRKIHFVWSKKSEGKVGEREPLTYRVGEKSDAEEWPWVQKRKATAEKLLEG